MSNSLSSAPRSPADVAVHFDAAFNRGDVEAVLSLFNQPATMRMTDGRVLECDNDALGGALSQLLGMRPTIRNEVRRVLQCDDVALVLMDWTVTVQLPDGSTKLDKGTATQVMQRQADGHWRLKISNPLGIA